MRTSHSGVERQPNRLGQGGLIDRARPLTFQFDGARFRGYQGDTLASALLANGVTLVGRSFKYHRPRGVLTASSEEPNALVELRSGARREPNTRASVAELFEGLEARSQNRWPSLGFDIGAINSLLAPIFVAGFYYKTFMWPATLWERLYEPLIRRAAGLGRASLEPDPDNYEKATAFCDVLIVGGGPAGLSAALAAGRSGARVILCDEDFLLGGRLNADNREINGMSAIAWTHQTEAELAAMPEVRIMRRTTVFGVYDGNTFGAVERVSDHLPLPPPHQPRQRCWKIIARRAVLAAGSIERPIVFGGNDCPGVMMASAVRTYLNRFGVTAGHCVVLFTTTDDGWRTASELGRAGIAVPAIIDPRNDIHPSLLAQAARIESRILLGARVVRATGSQRLNSVEIRDREGRLVHIAADTLAMSGGWTPSIALTTHLGARPRWSDSISAFVAGEKPRGMMVVGAAHGSFTLADALREGAAAGAEAAGSTGFNVPALQGVQSDDELQGVSPMWQVAESRGKAFVDFQHDVTREDIALAAREGYDSVELMKRYTTLGMATDQGKTSNINGHAILSALANRSISQIGTTAFRPPYTPVALGALAGHLRGKEFRPTRLTSGHEWARERGAVFVEAGQWLRAQWFAQPEEKDWLEIVIREVVATRTGVGVCDVSTLGKIDLQGPDAGQFLDRLYCNVFSTLSVNRVRYGLMLREDGFVMDDGTSAHLAPGHYIMSTTTANAAKVMQHLEHARQVLWPQLDVQIVSVTEQWSQYSIAGPRSRELLQRLLGGALDISNAAFPYLACIEFRWRGVNARLFRISFSGELAYELAVPARYGDAAIRAIMEAGEALSVTPYGTEALGVMRIEKGHLAGNELNGMTTAADLGLGRMMSTKKDYIGRTLAGRPALIDPDRPMLVGLRPVDRSAQIHAGAHLLSHGAEAKLASDDGYVTSVAYSPTIGSWVGLGLLSRGPARHGERVRAFDPVRGSDLQVEVVPPVFVDPDGRRLKS